MKTKIIENKKLILYFCLGLLLCLTTIVFQTGALLLLFGFSAIMIYENNYKSLLYFIILILSQTMFLILFANSITPNQNSLFMLVKEVLLYGSVFVGFLLSIIFNRKKNTIIDYAFLTFIVVLLISFILSTTGINTRLLAIRQVLIPFICFYYGYYLKTENIISKFSTLIIYVGVMIAIFGFIELFILGDEFWLNLPFHKYLENKGVVSWMNKEGVTGNFYTYDYINLTGNKIRRLVSIFADPLVSGHILFLSGLLSLKKLRYEKRKKDILLFVIILIASILTFSKGIYLLFFVSFAVYIFVHAPKKIRYLMCSFAVFAVISLVVYAQSVTNIETATSTSNHVNGLFISIKNINLFGYGLGSAGSYVSTVSGLTSEVITTESFIGSIITQLGAIGLVVFFFFFVYMGIKLYSMYDKTKDLDILIALILLVGILVESFLSESSISVLGSGLSFVFIGMVYSKFEKDNLLEKVNSKKMNIFIIGSKGIPSNYGGFETFVEKLTEKKVSDDLQYHVSCMSDNNDKFIYNNASCFNVKVPNIGPAKAVYYDLAALDNVINYIEKNEISDAIIYVLACRIGPFFKSYVEKLHELNCTVLVNPDGHEWKREKWNSLIRKYWKLSEKLMVKHADLLVCDSINIEKYINDEYKKYQPSTTYIAYGADVGDSVCSDEELNKWYDEKGVAKNEYYLVVGRFVPENNYEIMIREFMSSSSKKDFVIITNVEENKFYESLKESTGFDNDSRIKFVGTVYNQGLLTAIRRNAYGYFHGHEVGGTNPSLLEALATTNINLLLDVGFNEEVGKDGALYWPKTKGALAELINYADNINKSEIDKLSKKAKIRIDEAYSWKLIVSQYEKLFSKIINEGEK